MLSSRRHPARGLNRSIAAAVFSGRDAFRPVTSPSSTRCPALPADDRSRGQCSIAAVTRAISARASVRSLMNAPSTDSLLSLTTNGACGKLSCCWRPVTGWRFRCGRSLHFARQCSSFHDSLPPHNAAFCCCSSVEQEIADRLTEARERTLLLISGLSDEDLHRQHDPLMSPIIWDGTHCAFRGALADAEPRRRDRVFRDARHVQSVRASTGYSRISRASDSNADDGAAS